jgi:hypothetical protein
MLSLYLSHPDAPSLSDRKASVALLLFRIQRLSLYSSHLDGFLLSPLM